MLAGLGFMVWLAWRLLHDSSSHGPILQVSGVVGAIAIGVVANAVVALSFGDLVSKSTQGDAWRGVSAFYFSQVAKYVPGRVAAILVQKSIIDGPQALSATIVSNVELTIISAWLCTGAALALLATAHTVIGSVIIAVVTVAVGASLMLINWQPLVRRVLDLAPVWIANRAPLVVHRKINVQRAIILSAGMLILPASSSYVLLRTGINVEVGLVVPLTAVLLLSWVGGSLAFVFPAGIGVRELIFLGLGGALWHAPSAELIAAIAIASRLVQVSIDAAGVLLFAFWRSVRRVLSGVHDEH